MKKTILSLISFGLLGVLACAEEGTLVQSSVAALAGDPQAEVTNVYTVGVVLEGSDSFYVNLLQNVQHELASLLDEDQAICVLTNAAFNAQWDSTRIKSCFDAALEDEDVDMVFASGLLLAAEVLERSDLPKPVVMGLPEDPELIGVRGLHSNTDENVSFVVVPQQVSRDLTTFHDMVPFSQVSVLVDGRLKEYANKVVAHAELLETKEKVTVDLLSVNHSVDAVLASIGTNVQAVYLTSVMRLSQDDWKTLIDGLNAKKLPTFSMTGKTDVELGVLAGQAPQIAKRLARHIAVNVQQILKGTEPETLRIRMPDDNQLVVNAATANEIGYTPTRLALTSAEIIGGEIREPGEDLNVAQAVELGIENNAQLAIQQAATRVTEQDKNMSMGVMLPQIGANARYNQVDRDRAENSGGAIPEKKTTVGATASQMIFNDPLISARRAANRVYDGALETQEAIRLDTINNVAQAYVTYLQAKALRKIEGDNLRLTQKNLELAKVRYQVGTSGPEEVNRWESSAATQRAQMLSAESTMQEAMLALNQVLGVELNQHWNAEDIEVDQNKVFLLGGEIDQFVGNTKQLERLVQFLVDYGLESSPRLKSLDKSLEAVKIEYDQYRRRYVVPELGVSFEYNHTLNEDKINEAGVDDNSSDDEWVAAVTASLPLFEGGNRHYRVSRAKAAMDQLRETKRQLSEQVEQNIRGALEAISSSFPSVGLQRRASDFAAKNLAVVQDKYARGTVSILDLLDAQNQSFVANQNAAIARYSYLQDVYRLQRAISWFEVEKSNDELSQFKARISNFVNE